MNPTTFGAAFDQLAARLGKPANTRIDDDGMWHAEWAGYRYEVIVWIESTHDGTAIIEARTGNGDPEVMTASDRWIVSSKNDAVAMALGFVAEQGVALHDAAQDRSNLMRTTPSILALSIALAGCAPALRFPGDWDAAPDASEARTDSSRADATDGAHDARSDASDARTDRAEVLSVDVPGADVVVMGGDSAVVWITDAPDASDAGVADAPIVADVPAVDVQAPVDAPVVADVLPPCGVLEARCGGACVPLLTTAAHCGACGRACPSPANGVGVCNGGRCEVACAEGYADCGRGCQSVQSDRENCGRCGQVCGTRETCVAGNCAGCATGESVCGGACVNMTRDASNCGGCGRVCRGGRSCVLSECVFTPCGASAGSVVCDGRCANIYTDRLNCGECGRSCEAGQSCSWGDCGG